MRPNILFNF